MDTELLCVPSGIMNKEVVILVRCCRAEEENEEVVEGLWDVFYTVVGHGVYRGLFEKFVEHELGYDSVLSDILQERGYHIVRAPEEVKPEGLPGWCNADCLSRHPDCPSNTEEIREYEAALERFNDLLIEFE